MRNYVQKGDTITLAAPYEVASGAGLLVGSIFGVASGAAANGATVEAVTKGVFDLKAKGTDTGNPGAKVYWDNTAKECTVTATDNSLIGVLLVAKTNGQTTMRVRLNGVSV
jgi:predicted RecA/RadA family phage recombinase